MTAETFPTAGTGERTVGIAARAIHFARNNVLFVVGATLFVLIVLAAIFAPLIAPFDPVAINFADKLDPPNGRHLMGTNELGQDIFSQVLYGARTSLLVGVVVVDAGDRYRHADRPRRGLFRRAYGHDADARLRRVPRLPPAAAADRDLRRPGHGPLQRH